MSGHNSLIRMAVGALVLMGVSEVAISFRDAGSLTTAATLENFLADEPLQPGQTGKVVSFKNTNGSTMFVAPDGRAINCRGDARWTFQLSPRMMNEYIDLLPQDGKTTDAVLAGTPDRPWVRIASGPYAGHSCLYFMQQPIVPRAANRPSLGGQ